ncbi:MAG: WHG domain-containing protein [Pseudomonadota bacterium]
MDGGETSSGRDAYHHGDLKAALIQAGMEMLEEVGLEKLSLRGIAARVGVSHAAPKNHFDGLRGLLSAIAAEGFQRHSAAMTEGLDASSSRQDRLRAAAEGYVAFARENPALFRLMFSPGLLDRDNPALCAAGQKSYAVLTGIAEDLDWTTLDGSETTQRHSELMLWSLVHGYAHLLISGRLSDPEHAPPTTAVMPWMDYKPITSRR